MDNFKIKYKEESLELIAEIEKSLLLMENNPDDFSLAEQVFRAMHTLKGNSAMFGFRTIADFTHHLESMYDLIRAAKIKTPVAIINITLSAMDHLSLLVNSENIPDETTKKAHEKISAEVIEIISRFGQTAHDNEPGQAYKAGAVALENNAMAYHVFFKPHKDILLNGINPLYLIEALHKFGPCKVVAHTGDIPSLEECDTASCYTSWDIYFPGGVDVLAVRDIFCFIEDKCTLEINQVPGHHSLMDTPALPVSPGILPLPEGDKEASGLHTKKYRISSIRVPSERLDSLMSLVSELMTLQAKLGMFTEQNSQLELLAVTENLEKISTRLRDNAFSMCLVPVENIVTPFHRLVRDLAAELNKEIEFSTEGTETEIDKNIMEGLSDPLMHLLRNSIDHGIEDPDEREKSGKPRQGKILFKAFCAGTSIYIEIQDDGKGIDPGKIKKKAIQKGIIGKDDLLNDKELLNLIFLPGFSTAEQVSEISGRGVGMDVVKRKITDIRGQIKINSAINAGTIITIKLPVTMSIIDGLLVKINDDDFVIPLSAVDKCYEAASVQLLNKLNNLVVFEGEQIPFISLREEFGAEGIISDQEMVIVNYDEKKVGLLVDRVVGKFQAVLKPLGKHFQQMDNISGATILGDGKIAMVLDTNKVVEQFLYTKNLSICS